MKKMAVGALLAGITVLGLSNAPAAQADTHVTAVKLFCLYEHSNYGGGHYCATPPVEGYRTVSLPGKYWKGTKRSANNSASSMKNDTGCKVWLYDVPDRDSKTYKAKPRSKDSTFSNNGFNDKASQIVFECPRVH